MQLPPWARPLSEEERPPYKRLWVRGRLLQWWLVAMIVLDVAMLAFSAIHYSLLNDALAGTIDEGALVASDSRMAALGVVLLISYGITVVLFLFWFHRAYKNLRALGIRKLGHKTPMAIFSWFIPIYTWFGPKAIANEIWRGSEPNPPSHPHAWTERHVPPLLHWWWALWLLNLVAGQVSWRIWRGADTLEAERTATIADFFTIPVEMVAAFLAVLVVRAITRREEDSAQALNRPPEPEGGPDVRAEPAPQAATV
jgi:hypothetical protein